MSMTDPIADNLAGNVVGQLIGQAARFYLFRKYVFRSPVTVTEFMHLPHGGAAHLEVDQDPVHRSSS